MTKDHALAFLTEAGHIASTEDLSEQFCRIDFMYRGKQLSLFAYDDDEDYFDLRCTYPLEHAINDELQALRTLARLQDEYKVVKFSFDISEPCVIADAEQFVPGCEAFAAIFWRSVGLVTSAARDAAHELNTTVVADSAAERFIEQLEMELQRRDGGNENTV
jgi:hypothetical protein